MPEHLSSPTPKQRGLFYICDLAMALYSISSKEIHDKYHRTSNATAKAVYKDILRKRADLGSKEARQYLYLIEGGSKSLRCR